MEPTPAAVPIDVVHYRRLASAVVAAAVHDMTRLGNRDRRWDAFLFLATENEDLAFWCALAGVDTKSVRRFAQKRWYRPVAA